MFPYEVEAQLNRLHKMGPLNDEEQYKMTQWLKGAWNKMVKSLKENQLEEV